MKLDVERLVQSSFWTRKCPPIRFSPANPASAGCHFLGSGGVKILTPPHFVDLEMTNPWVLFVNGRVLDIVCEREGAVCCLCMGGFFSVVHEGASDCLYQGGCCIWFVH